MDDISQEAKDALAALQWRRAKERLYRDGSDSTPALQRRVRALAAEWSIPPADYAKLMYKRVTTQAVIDFCNKHNVSTDWLLTGDLRGLQRMTRDRPAQRPRPPVLTPEEFGAAYAQLSSEVQAIISATIRRLLPERQP